MHLPFKITQKDEVASKFCVYICLYVSTLEMVYFEMFI